MAQKSFEQLLKEAKERENRRQMTHTGSSTQSTSYQDARRRFLPNLAQGSAAGLVGAPVDIVNAALSPFTGSKKPVMGSEWIGERLKSDTNSPAFTVGQFIDPLSLSASLAKLAPLALGGVIKNKGGNWLGDSVENAMQKLKHTEFTPNPKQQKLNDWVDGPLTKYAKNRMASPDDEIRKLADQGILHVDPEQLNYNQEMYGRAGSGPRLMAQSDLAKAWEGVTDNSVSEGTVQDALNYYKPGSSARETFLENYPWVGKADPSSKTYSLAEQEYFTQDLGFDHLMDELNNAMNPTSGLPQNLRLTPEGLQGLSVEEAVKKVDGINKHRALQAEAARKQMSKAEGIQTTKTYDDGFRFVAPEDVTKNPKHKEYVKNTGKRGAWCTQGDACDHYAGGDSRVVILLDDFGNPHAQIAISNEFDRLVNNPEFIADFWRNQPYEYRERIPDADEIKIIDSPEFQKYVDDRPPYITEIKPLGNSWGHEKVKELMAKDPYYKAKIQEKLQDFVKSGNWSDVQDLENADLMRINDGSYISIDDVTSDPKFIDWAIDNDINPVSTDDYFSEMWRRVYNDYLRSQVGGGI